MTDPHANAIEAAELAMNEVAKPHALYNAGEATRACIAAYLAAMEAAGSVMVPVEATPNMEEEALFANDNALLMSADCTDMGNAYRAMIAARPRVEGV